MRALLWFVPIAVSASIVTAAAAPAAPSPGRYEVFAIRYSTLPDFPVSSLVKGAAEGRTMELADMIWLIRGDGRNVLVDTGFYRPQFFENWKVGHFVRPDKAVELAGVKAGEITDVILTHAHWDHMDGLDLFPNAQVWIQREEYVHYSGEAWQKGAEHGGIDPDDIIALVKVNLAGRLHLVSGDGEILPGVRVFIGGKHTWESQYVVVDAKPGPVVIASDNVYLYENLDKRLPIAQTFDEKSNLRAQERMRSMVRDLRFIIPGHDPQVLERFPKVAEGVVRIE